MRAALHICCACFTHNDLPCCNPGHHGRLTEADRALADRGHDGGAFSDTAVERILARHLSDHIIDDLNTPCDHGNSPVTCIACLNDAVDETAVLAELEERL